MTIHRPPSSGRQRLLRISVRLLAGLLLVWGILRFAQDWRATLPVPPADLALRAYLPDNGGWVSEPLRVASGRDVRLTVKTMEGAHALGIAHTGVGSGLLTPGPEQVIEFTAPAPGRYVLACTVWCGPNHWRMRTVLEVVDPAAPAAPLQYAQDAPRYPIDWNQLDADAPHPAAAWPSTGVDTKAGAFAWQRLGAGTDPATVLAQLDWPLVSPSETYLALQDGRVLPSAAGLEEAELWALVAFLWESQTTPAALVQGATLYAENCAACHGEDGSGNGFAAAESPGVEPDFHDAPTAAGAQPLQRYAKIARGGMGTGMPNWGTVLGEDDLWAVTIYLYTFVFHDPRIEGKIIDVPNIHSDSAASIR